MNEAGNTTNFKLMAFGLFDDKPVEESHRKRKGCCAGIEHRKCKAALGTEVRCPWDGKKRFYTGNEAASAFSVAWPQKMLEGPKLNGRTLAQRLKDHHRKGAYRGNPVVDNLH